MWRIASLPVWQLSTTAAGRVGGSEIQLFCIVSVSLPCCVKVHGESVRSSIRTALFYLQEIMTPEELHYNKNWPLGSHVHLIRSESDIFLHTVTLKDTKPAFLFVSDGCFHSSVTWGSARLQAWSVTSLDLTSYRWVCRLIIIVGLILL